MGNDLMAEEVEIDPSLGAAGLLAAEHAAIKFPGGSQVVDWKCEVKQVW